MSDGARVVAGVLCLLVLISAPVVAQSVSQAGIGEVSISGGGVVTPETGNSSTYLWQDEPVNVSVTVADYPEARNYGVCLRYARENAPAKKLVGHCEPLRLPNGTNGTAEFANVTWPANVTGGQELVVEVRNRTVEHNTTVLDRKTVPVVVLRRQGDFDNDGLTNAREVEKGFNLSNSDIDADGLPDGAEVKQYKTKPQRADSDGDGIRDGVELQRGTDPTEPDTDGDGLNDKTEVTLGTDPTGEWTPIWLVVAVLVVIGVLAAVFVFLRRRWRRRVGESAAVSDENGRPETASTDNEEESPEPTTVSEPLTDEDRVQALLRENGGRMKQSHIVEETDWSKAKVSRLLSSMNDEGTIEKLSIGRENIISLDGHGPEAAKSPHEENATD
ncbi:MAG TPA: IclR-like transcriptional regulator [Halococcus sp.]|nr:IclR-like transcriptional regulator [Halococcus sp.]